METFWLKQAKGAKNDVSVFTGVICQMLPGGDKILGGNVLIVNLK